MRIDFEAGSATDNFLTNSRLAVPRWLVYLIVVASLSLAVYHLVGGLFGTTEAFSHRTTHLVGFLILTFLVHPSGRNSWRAPLNAWVLIDGLLIVLAIGVFAYRIHDIDALASRTGFPDANDVVSGTILVLLVLEGVRRTVGWSLVALPALFMVHAVYSDHFPSVFLAAPTRFSSLIGYLTIDLDGMLGVPIAVSSSFIVIFMMFGAVLVRSGAGAFFTDLAYATTGWMAGGAAKAAAIASGLYGTLSGSTTANVVTTGSFTIPLMKSTGFRPGFAASVEAIASNGGQIVPPVMGAAAFIIPMYIPGTTYRDVVIAAAIPAVLYFVSILAMIHFEARKMGLTGVSRESLPRIATTLAQGWPILFSFAAIVLFLLNGFTPMIAGSVALLITVFVTSFNTKTRLSVRSFLAALESGIRSAIPVVMACAAAGLIVGSMNLSGLAGRISGTITVFADGNLFLALLTTAVVCVILGMGMTTTIIYITLAALVVPSVVEMGAPVLAANLFVFYFGALSGVTPPVALTTYAAAGIAGSNPWTTGWEAVKVGVASFIIPFMFVYSPGLLLNGPLSLVVIQTATACVGVVCLAAAMQGFFAQQLQWWQRWLVGLAALLLIAPGYGSALTALVLLLAAFWRSIAQRFFGAANNAFGTDQERP